MTRKPRLLALAMVALLASAPNVRADQPVAESDQVLPARPLQNANPIEPSTTTMAYAASAQQSGQPSKDFQSLNMSSATSIGPMMAGPVGEPARIATSTGACGLGARMHTRNDSE